MTPIYNTVGLLIGLLVVALLTARFKPHRAKSLQRAVAHGTRLFEQLSLRAKGKQLLSFYQVATRIADVYEVPMPSEVAQLLSVFEVLNVNVAGVGLPLQCLNLNKYEQQLAFTMLMPVVLAVTLLCCFVVRELRRAADDRISRATLRRGLLAALPWLLSLTFLVFPMVSSAAFQAFSCEDFDDGRSSYLRADYSVECGTATHERAKSLAWLGIALYPVGISVLYIRLFVAARSALIDKRPT